MQLLAGLGPLGVPELLIIAFIVLLVFGVGRLPDVGGAVGKSIREFRKATKDDAAASTDPSSMPSPMPSASSGPMPAPAVDTMIVPVAPSADAVFCSECGARNIRSAKFCAECGKPMPAPVS